MRANFVGKSVVSAITQTPASGPFELVTTPPISAARTSTVCWARKPVEHANVRIESKANASKLRSASAKWNMDRLPGVEAGSSPVFVGHKSNKAAEQRPADFDCGFFSLRNHRHPGRLALRGLWGDRARHCDAGTGRNGG